MRINKKPPEQYKTRGSYEINSTFAIALLMFTGNVITKEQTTVNNNADKLADDPTKVTTKLGVSYANNFDFNDDNYSFSGSYALGQARKLNARTNSDASEWKIDDLWLFLVGSLNFNLGKSEYTNGAN